ncbi:MAG TPA: DUF2845 domain-containing protein [Polyangia bacterium]|nr:DUF2845 domain-containing protein [Polyangia bacterium]
MKLVLGLVFGLAVALAGVQAPPTVPAARADSGFRCPGGRIISTGDHMSEVRKKCGEPDSVAQRIEKRKIKVKVRRWTSPTEEEEITEEREIEVLVDEWTYDFGAERFVRHVAFEDARVVGVTTGAYGSRS